MSDISEEMLFPVHAVNAIEAIRIVVMTDILVIMEIVVIIGIDLLEISSFFIFLSFLGLWLSSIWRVSIGILNISYIYAGILCYVNLKLLSRHRNSL